VIGAALLAVALAMAWRLKGGWVTPLIVAVGGVAGWLLL
jgi:chromate transporter